MSGFFTLLEAAAHFAKFETNMKFAHEAILIEWAQLVQKKAKEAIGTYRYKWPALADSTQLERERQGYSANEPGLRRGDMRDSIQASVDAARGVARVGSNDDHLVWFELGTKHQPPRSVLAASARASQADLGKIARKYIRSAWTSAGHDNSLLNALHVIKRVLEVAHQVYKVVEKHTKEKR